jgi:hypothetical protein
MSDETKVTMKIGVIAAGVASLIVFVLSVLWAHNGDISMLKANQQIVMQSIVKLDAAVDKIPERLASIDAQLVFISGSQRYHTGISVSNNKLLKNGNNGTK